MPSVQKTKVGFTPKVKTEPSRNFNRTAYDFSHGLCPIKSLRCATTSITLRFISVVDLRSMKRKLSRAVTSIVLCTISVTGLRPIKRKRNSIFHASMNMEFLFFLHVSVLSCKLPSGLEPPTSALPRRRSTD